MGNIFVTLTWIPEIGFVYYSIRGVGWSWRPAGLQTLQSKFDSYLTLNNCPGGGIGRHDGLRSRKLRVRVSPWVQV